MTTEANEIVNPFHDRIPVILGANAVDVWLKPGDMTEEIATKILVPAPKTLLVEFGVSTIVNSPKSDKASDNAADDMVLEHCSRPLADKFQVSAEAMRIRLQSMGLLLRNKEALLF